MRLKIVSKSRIGATRNSPDRAMYTVIDTAMNNVLPGKVLRIKEKKKDYSRLYWRIASWIRNNKKPYTLMSKNGMMYISLKETVAV